MAEEKTLPSLSVVEPLAGFAALWSPLLLYPLGNISRDTWSLRFLLCFFRYGVKHTV